MSNTELMTPPEALLLELQKKITEKKKSPLLPVDISDMPKEGNRQTYFTSMAGKLRSMGKETNAIYEHLSIFNASLDNPLPDHEVRSISQSVGSYDVSPVVLYNNEQDASDFIATLIQKNHIHVPELGWHYKENDIWLYDIQAIKAKTAIQQNISSACMLLTDMASEPRDDDGKLKKQILSLIKRLKSNNYQKSILAMLSSNPNIVVSQNKLDTHSNIIGANNGLYHLKERKIIPDNDYFVTKRCNIIADNNADCPRFKAFCEEILPDKETRDYVLTFFAYCLFGEANLQKIMICIGKGRNGKSTLFDVMHSLFHDYFVALEPDSVTRNKGGSISNDIASLLGARLCSVSELPMGSVLDAVKVKRLSGNDIISARKLYSEYFNFKNKAVMTMQVNYMPVINGGDFAIVRRLSCVKFEQVIPKDKVDYQLHKKLNAELSGVFNLLIEYLHRYFEYGLIEPEKVKQDTLAYCEQSNLYMQYFDQNFELSDKKTRYGSDALFSAYKEWKTQRCYTTESQNTFSNAFEDLEGVNKNRDADGYYFTGFVKKSNSLLLL